MTDDKKTNGSSVELPAGGIPGLPQELQVAFGYADGDPRNEPPGGKPGKYKLVFTLSRPGIRPLAEYANSFEKGLTEGLYFGIGFAASNGLVTNLFRAEPLSLFLIENGQIASTMVIMGSILSVWS